MSLRAGGDNSTECPRSVPAQSLPRLEVYRLIWKDGGLVGLGLNRYGLINFVFPLLLYPVEKPHYLREPCLIVDHGEPVDMSVVTVSHPPFFASGNLLHLGSFSSSLIPTL